MRYCFSELGTFFSTRERGAEVRSQIEELLKKADPDEPLILDFADVQMVSFSFADEVVGRLLENRKAGGFGDRAILLTNMNSDTLDPIHRSLERRKLIAVFIATDGRVRLMSAPQHLEETFGAAEVRKEFATPELAADLQISIPACNNRLRPLVDAGVLKRRAEPARAGGKKFVYSSNVRVA